MGNRALGNHYYGMVGIRLVSLCVQGHLQTHPPQVGVTYKGKRVDGPLGFGLLAWTEPYESVARDP
eukprot:scaffold41277_cov22-Tisochrysis_lutea.AAC.2